MLHGHKRVDVFAALGEKVVPAANETSLVLVVDEVERIARPRLLHLRMPITRQLYSTAPVKGAVTTHLLDEFLKRHLSLRLDDNVADDGLVPL